MTNFKPYVFKPDDAMRFAREQGISYKVVNNNLVFRECPYCKSKKDKDTFAISLDTGKFQCFRNSCGVKGNMITLSKDFDFSLGVNVDNYYKIPKKQYRKYAKHNKPFEPFEITLKYLGSRKISEEVIRKYQITGDKQNPNNIVFPFIDTDGCVSFIKYRNAYYKKGDKYKEWSVKDCKPILFGMYQCNFQNPTLVITEGQIDSLSVATAGIENAVSVPTGARGFTWVPFCWDFMHKFREIIVFGDLENGSMSLLSEIKSRFRHHSIRYVKSDDYMDCKDANEILCKYGIEQVQKCVREAVSVPIAHIKNLADVEDIDIYKWEKLPTGINELDRMLYGGLPFGGVTIIGGKAGNGKSTLASQILLSALEFNYKVFAYSGELSEQLFKAWLMMQTAGNRTFEYQNAWGDKGYTISKANKQIISEWYRDKIYIYSNDDLADEEEDVGLVKTCEEVICKLGVRVLLIDNLMTALDLDENKGNGKFEKQEKFVKKLQRLAKSFNVLILLVAHKKKANNFGNDEIDSISGSADIVNLGMAMLTYDRVANNDDFEYTEENDRVLRLIKSRIAGKIYTKGWLTHFNERGKHIYGKGDEEIRTYSCFKDDFENQGFVESEETDNPFI